MNVKNEKNVSGKFKMFRRCLSVVLASFILLFTNCDSWMKSDEFFGVIDEEVKYANAEKISVFVRYANTKEGTTNIDGTTTQKVEVPFTVSAVTSDAYGFYKWAAFSTSDYSTGRQHAILFNDDADYIDSFLPKEISSSIVTFDDPYSPETTVTINSARNDIFIIPIVAERPKIATSLPASGASNVVKNMAIRVVFSKKMDETTLLDTDESGNVVLSDKIDIYRTYGDFDNITLKSIKDIFTNVSLGATGKTLTIRLSSGKTMPPNTSIRVIIDGEVKDAYGYEMGQESTILFTTGTASDSLSPTIQEIYGGFMDANSWGYNQNQVSEDTGYHVTSTDLDAFSTSDEDSIAAKILTHRTTGLVNLWIYALDITETNSTPTEADVYQITLTATSLTNSSGETSEGTTEKEFFAYETGGNSSDVAMHDNTHGCQIAYDVSSLPDGLIRIDVGVTDTIGNDSFTPVCVDNSKGNYYKSIYVIKDTTKPDAESNFEKLKSDSADAPYGWYNATTIGTMEIYEEDDNLIIDNGNTKLVSLPENMKWIFKIGGDSSWKPSTSDSGWKIIKGNRYRIADASCDTDGPVDIQMRLMDDLGNISDAVHLESIMYDGTKPAIGTLSWTGDGELEGITQHNPLTTQTLSIPFTEVTSGVKFIELTSKKNGTTAAAKPLTGVTIALDGNVLEAGTDYTNDGNKITFTESKKSGTFTITGIKVTDATANTDGIYTIGVDLTDLALNKTATTSEISVSLDKTNPKVENVKIADLVERIVYNQTKKTYWISKEHFDTERNANKNKLEVTITENGSGIKKIELGGNAKVTSSSVIAIGTTEYAAGTDFEIDTESNAITLTNGYSPILRTDSGTLTFYITNVDFTNKNSAEGNTLNITLTDFVALEGNNAGKIKLESGSDITEVYVDSENPSVNLVTLTDRAQNSANNSVTSLYKKDEFTDERIVDLTIKLDAESAAGAGVKAIKLTNATFGSETTATVYGNASTVDGTALDETAFTKDGDTVTFKEVFTGTEEIVFTNVTITGEENGTQTVGATAKDLIGWVSERTDDGICYDNVSPEIGTLSWTTQNDANAIAGITKDMILSTQVLNIPYTEATAGIKKITIEVTKKEETSASTSTPFDSSDFKVKAGGTVVAYTKDTTETNSIILTTPVNAGVITLEYLKISDTDEEGTYTVKVKLLDAAENTEEKSVKTINIAKDSTKPVIEAIEIPDLKKATLFGSTSSEYWLDCSMVGGNHSGNYAPTQVTVNIEIDEGNSGVSQIDFGGTMALQSSTTLHLVEDGTESETDITSKFTINTSSNFIKVNDSDDSLKNAEGKSSFTLRLKNVKFTKYNANANTITVTATDVALNKSDETDKSKKLTVNKGTDTTPATLIADFHSDSWSPGLKGTKIYRPNQNVGAIDLNDTRATHTNNTKNILVVQTGKEGSDASGHNAIEITSGGKFTTDTKIYYVTDTTYNKNSQNVTLGADDSLPSGATKITSDKFEISEDATKVTFKDSDTYYVFRAATAIVFTNVEFLDTTSQGTKEIVVHAYDLVGWQDVTSESQRKCSITFDTATPSWSATKPIYMGSSISNDYIYPKAGNAGELISDERYFYSKASLYTKLYLSLGYTESNFYKVAYTTGTTINTEAGIIASTSVNLKDSGTNMELSTTSNPVYNFVIVDKAGNYSTVQKAHAIQDSKVINSVSSGDDDAVNTAVQAKMTYKTSESTSYKIFESNTLSTSVAVASSIGVDSTGTAGTGYPVYFNTSSSARVQVDLSEFAEIQPTATNSGIAYYAVNGSITAPSSTGISTDWNYWIPFNKTKPVVDLYVKSTGHDPGFVRLWLKDNVGNTKYVYVRNSENTDTARKASTENDIWLFDNTAPLKSSSHSIDINKAAGSKPQTYNRYQSYATQADDYDYGYMMPEGMCMFYDGTVREQDTSLIQAGSDSSSNPNRMFLTRRARLTATLNGERCYGEVTSSRPADENYYSVRVVLHASSSYSPYSSEDTYRNWIKNGDSTETADEIKARFRYAASKTETFLIESLPYPPGLCAERPYVHIVAEDAVGNLSAITLALYPAGKYWYSKFIMDNEPPKVYIRNTSDEVDGTTDIQKLAPPVYGKKVYTDSNGVTWFPSYGNADKAPTSESDVVQGNHMTRWADSDTAHANEQFARPYFDIDIDEDNLLAFYYSNGQHSTTLKYGDEGDEIVTVNTYPLNDFITGTEIGNSHWGSDGNYTNWGDRPDLGWMILDHYNNTRQGKVNAIIPHGCTNIGGEGKPIYLHLADRVGNITTIKMGDTKWARDNNIAIMGANEDGTLNSWPTKDPSILEEGLYYLKQTDDRGTLDIQFSRKANAQPYVDVYIPAEWYADPTTANPGYGGAGIYGYAWETGDVTKVQINNDETDTKHYKKPFIRFEKSKGHYEITSATPIYIYDNVGNVALTRNDANETVNFVAQNSIKSSLDLNAPKLKLSLAAQSGYTSGKFYDAAKVTTSNAAYTVYIGGSSSYEFSDSGTGAGYSSSNPYIIYTNANSGSSTDKTCKLKLSLSSSDDDLYTLKITKNGETPTTYTGTSNVTSAITNGIPIEFGASDTVINYEIALYDFASNETKVYLKFVKDMDAPTFTPIATATKGSIGVYESGSGSSKKYYHYYNSMDITFTPDDGTGIGVASYNLVISGVAKTAKTDTTYKISTADYASSLGTNDTLKVTVTDKLGNAATKYIKVGSTEVSDTSNRYWARDTVAPSISSFTGMTTSGGRGTLKTSLLYYIETKNRNGNTVSYADKDYTIKFSASDSTGQIKGYFISTNDSLTAVPASTTLESKNEIKIKPSNYVDSSTGKGDVYFYAVDYAGNISTSKQLTIEKYTGQPIFSDDCTITGPLYSDGGYTYYTKDTKVTFTVKDPLSDIKEYGLVSWINSITNDNYAWYTIYEGTLAKNTEHTFTVPISNDTFKNAEGKILGIDIYAVNDDKGITYKHITTTGFLDFWIEDNSAPSVAGLAISEATAPDDSGKVYLDGTNVFFSQADTPVTLTITGSPDDNGGSGFKGYSIGADGEVSTDGTLTFTTSTSGDSYEIFAWDNLGNKSKVGGFTTELDNTVSSIESLTLTSPTSGEGAYFDETNKKLYYNSEKAASVGVTVLIDDTDVDHYFYDKGEDTDKVEAEDGAFTITPAEGTLRFYAVDKLGNVSTTPYTITLVQDTTVAKPEVSGISAIEKETNTIYPTDSCDYVFLQDGIYYYNSNKIGSFKLAMNEITGEGSGFDKFTCTDATAAFDADTNTITLTSPNGEVAIKAVDKVGNVSAAATLNFEKISKITIDSNYSKVSGEFKEAHDSNIGDSWTSNLYKDLKYNITIKDAPLGYYYGYATGETDTPPTTGIVWSTVLSPTTDGSATCEFAMPEITELHKNIFIYAKDPVGNEAEALQLANGSNKWWLMYTPISTATCKFTPDSNDATKGTITITLSQTTAIQSYTLSEATKSGNAQVTLEGITKNEATSPFLADSFVINVTDVDNGVQPSIASITDAYGKTITSESGISLSANINAGIPTLTSFFANSAKKSSKKATRMVTFDEVFAKRYQTSSATSAVKTATNVASKTADAVAKAVAKDETSEARTVDFSSYKNEIARHLSSATISESANVTKRKAQSANIKLTKEKEKKLMQKSAETVEQTAENATGSANATAENADAAEKTQLTQVQVQILKILLAMFIASVVVGAVFAIKKRFQNEKNAETRI